MDKKMQISDLKQGQRFFAQDAWHNFVSANVVGDCWHIIATNGYNSEEYLVWVYTDSVTIPYGK